MAVDLNLDFSVLSETVEFDIEEQDADLEFGEVQQVTTSDHRQLINRDKPDQHPILAITNLNRELDRKQNSDDVMTNMDIQRILDL